MEVECSPCGSAMARLCDAAGERGEPVAVFLCPSCGGRVAVQDDAPPATPGRNAEPEGATLHGVDVAYPARGGES